MAGTKKKYYAWAPITVKNPVNGGVTTIPAGDEVDPKALASDWDQLLSAGSVRSTPYPDTKAYESPNSATLRAAREAMEAAQAPFRPDRADDDDDDDDEGVKVSEPNG